MNTRILRLPYPNERAFQAALRQALIACGQIPEPSRGKAFLSSRNALGPPRREETSGPDDLQGTYASGPDP